MEKDIQSIVDSLKKMHGSPRCELNFSNPIELVVATILSARCTDERVNGVTTSLFRKYRNFEDYINVPQEELENDIKPTGFYRNKAKSIKNVSREILHKFKGEIPRDMDAFAEVSGIGRKSANMIVGLAYRMPAVIVDAHVARVSKRLGLTRNEDPEKIEVDLKGMVDELQWTDLSLLVILHGRYVCKARRPDCQRCLIGVHCDYLMGGNR